MRLSAAISSILFACLLVVLPAYADFQEGGDIPWEPQMTAYVTTFGPVLSSTDPNTADQGNGVPDLRDLSFFEKVIMDPATLGHLPQMVTAINANLASFQSENPELATGQDLIFALFLTAGYFDMSNSFSVAFNGKALTSSLYTSFAVLGADGDIDVDGIVNRLETGTDAASYVANATTPEAIFELIEGGDIPWESQFAALYAVLAPVLHYTNAQQVDVISNSIPDLWDLALCERILADPAAPGHTSAMVSTFNANLKALRLENYDAYHDYGLLLVTAITGGRLSGTVPLYSVLYPYPLTTSLYTEFPIAGNSGDPDGDAIINGNEYGYDAASYVANALTGTTSVGPQGGSVANLGGFQMLVPNGAFSSTASVHVEQTASPPVITPTISQFVVETIAPGTSFGISGIEGLNAGSEITVTLNYPDANQDGYVDGTDIDETGLVVLVALPPLYRVYNLGGEVDVARNTVTATADFRKLEAGGYGKTLVGSAKMLDGLTFMLGVVDTQSLPLSTGLTVILCALIMLGGVEAIKRFRAN